MMIGWIGIFFYPFMVAGLIVLLVLVLVFLIRRVSVLM
jgi:hypothetical protein